MEFATPSRDNGVGDLPDMNPGSAMPTLNYGLGVSQASVADAVTSAKHQLFAAARANAGNPNGEAQALQGQIPNLGEQVESAIAQQQIRVPTELPMYPGVSAPAVNMQGPTDQADMMQRVLGAQGAAELQQALGQQAQPQAPNGQTQIVATPTPAPPPQPQAPAMSPEIQAMMATTQQMQAWMAQQQAQAQAQQQWAAQEQERQRQASANAWQDTQVRDARLKAIGLDPEDPTVGPVGKMVWETYHTATATADAQNARIAQLEQMVQQQNQQFQQLVQGAQQRQVQTQIGQQLNTALARAPESVRQHAAGLVTTLMQAGMPADQAAARVLGMTIPLLPQSAPPPQMIPQFVQPQHNNFHNAMALGGGAQAPLRQPVMPSQQPQGHQPFDSGRALQQMDQYLSKVWIPR